MPRMGMSRRGFVQALGGRTVLPGFVDAHSHPAEAGLSHLKMVDCDLRSNAAILDALRERARKTPAGDWVLGFKYDDTKTSGDPPLKRGDLDAAVGAHPVFVAHRGGHTAWVNSKALDRAKVDEKTPDPPGGKYDRDPGTGKLTGHVREHGQDAFSAVIPARFTAGERRLGVRLICGMMSPAGITSVTDAWGGPGPSSTRAFPPRRRPTIRRDPSNR